MDQIVQAIRQRTGLKQDQAQQAAQAAIGALKQLLPQSVQGMVDQVLSGQQPVGSASQASNAAKGVFGS